MRIACCFFSGTGNTKRACETLADELARLGHTVRLFSIAKGKETPDFAQYECLIFGYPVHGFNAPAPFLKYLKRLPKTRDKTPCYLVRTSGEPLKLNGASGVSPKRILKRRGYLPMGEFHYVLPYNIIFRHSDGMAARMLENLRLRVPADAALISAGGKRLTRVGPLKRAAAFAVRIEHPAMPLIGRGFHVSADCIGCGKCEKVCPQGNIRMVDGKPEFGGSCAGCMACSFGCPADAVRISILNGWRVNGAYTFEGDPATDGEICRYCRKSYLKYFHEGENVHKAP